MMLNVTTLLIGVVICSILAPILRVTMTVGGFLVIAVTDVKHNVVPIVSIGISMHMHVIRVLFTVIMNNVFVMLTVTRSLCTVIIYISIISRALCKYNKFKVCTQTGLSITNSFLDWPLAICLKHFFRYKFNSTKFATPSYVSSLVKIRLLKGDYIYCATTYSGLCSYLSIDENCYRYSEECIYFAIQGGRFLPSL